METRLLSKTDIVVPVYNEAMTVPELLRRLRAACPDAGLIMVDNASTDGTLALLEAASDVQLIRHERNEGYGNSLVDGMRASRRDYVVLLDADLEFPPEDIPVLVEALAVSDAVIGSRFLPRPDGEPSAMPWHRSLGNGLVNFLFNRLFGARLSDVLTGARGFRRAAVPLDELRTQGWEFVLEVTGRMVHAGARVSEVPVHYHKRSRGDSKMRHLPVLLRFILFMLELRRELGGRARS